VGIPLKSGIGFVIDPPCGYRNQLACLVAAGVDHLGPKPRVALSDGDWREKPGRRAPVRIVLASLLFQMVFDGRKPLARNFISMFAAALLFGA
jgi:hypothetical protein